jgi:hypothetical protein
MKTSSKAPTHGIAAGLVAEIMVSEMALNLADILGFWEHGTENRFTNCRIFLGGSVTNARPSACGTLDTYVQGISIKW